MSRWLAIFNDDNGHSRSAMLTVSDATSFPFGVDENALGLADYNPGGGCVFVEMPDDAEFRPMVVDVNRDDEAPMQFIDV